MENIEQIIGKINGYKNIGYHSNNDYSFFDEIIEDLTNISNRFEQQVRQGVSSADETTGNSAEIRKVLLRLLNIANKQREYHLVNKLKNKKQETSLQKVEYGDNKAAESAYEFIIKEIMDEVSLTY